MMVSSDGKVLRDFLSKIVNRFPDTLTKKQRQRNDFLQCALGHRKHSQQDGRNAIVAQHREQQSRQYALK